MSLVKNKKVQKFFKNYDSNTIKKECICVTYAAIKCCRYNCNNEDYYKKGHQW